MSGKARSPRELVQRPPAIAENPLDNVRLEFDYPISPLLLVFFERTQLVL